jgi:hypothetical protein
LATHHGHGAPHKLYILVLGDPVHLQTIRVIIPEGKRRDERRDKRRDETRDETREEKGHREIRHVTDDPTRRINP